MKRNTIILLLFLLLPGYALGQKVAILSGHLIDPSTGTSVENQVILIEDGIITDVGADLDVSAAERVIDLTGTWVMPGLMDAHVHLTLNFPNDAGTGVSLAASYLTESNAFRALRGVKNARDVLNAGFTTVKDIGNDGNYTAIDLRRAINKGWIEGPTLINTGKIIAPFGGQSKGISPDQPRVWQFEYIDADTPDEVRKAVRQNIFYGATAIKLVADNSAFYYGEDEIRAAVEEAGKAGLPVSVHAYGGQAARNVIMAGAQSIEHGWMLDDELLRLMKEKGTFLVGTDFPLEHYRAMPMFFDDPEEISRTTIKRLSHAHEIGVKMAFGTDIVVDLLGRNRGELALDFLSVWDEAGIPAPEILKAMTTNAAELFRIQDERGAITAGQYADIVATPTNPLEDIQALRNIEFVMKEGEVVRGKIGLHE
jgi:imidazolonepropionase-like amidohydrolase